MNFPKLSCPKCRVEITRIKKYGILLDTLGFITANLFQEDKIAICCKNGHVSIVKRRDAQLADQLGKSWGVKLVQIGEYMHGPKMTQSWGDEVSTWNELNPGISMDEFFKEHRLIHPDNLGILE